MGRKRHTAEQIEPPLGQKEGQRPVVVARSLEPDNWAYWNGVALDFIRPGKPVDNAFIESFNGTVRRECLSQHWFTGLEDAQRTLDAWREDYNNTRPHRSLANQAPAKYRGGGHCVPDRNRLVNSLT